MTSDEYEIETTDDDGDDDSEELHESTTPTLYIYKDIDDEVPKDVLKVQVSDQVNLIPSETFEECLLLESIDFTTSSKVDSIGEAAFYKCKSLLEIHLPQHLTFIAKETFVSCINLQKVHLESPDMLESIEDYAFYGCKSLTTINLSNLNTIKIGVNAFYGCVNLTVSNDDHHLIPPLFDPTVFVYTGEEDGDFDVPADVKNVQIAASCTEIPKKTFMYRESLQHVDVSLATNIKSIGKHAFYRCKSLQSLDLSAATKLTTIGDQAFYGCLLLCTIRPLDEESSALEIGADALNFMGYYTYYGSQEEMVPPDVKHVKIASTVQTITKDAFCQCEKLKQVLFQEAVLLKSIGEEAFYYSESLLEVTLPPNITAISKSAFLGCSNMIQIHFNDKLQVIEEEAFEDCSSLIYIELPSTVKEIAKNAFFQCLLLQNVEFKDPVSLEVLGEEAFMSCKSLSSVVLPSTITSLGENVFDDCDRLESIDLMKTDRFNLALAIRLSALYPNQTATTLSMDRLLDTYSVEPLVPSKLLTPSSPEETQKLKDVQAAYVQSIITSPPHIADFPLSKEHGWVEFLAQDVEDNDDHLQEALIQYLKTAKLATVQLLATAKDAQERTALQVVANQNLHYYKVFQDRLLFLGRYKLAKASPMHKSDNAILITAEDFKVEEHYASGYDRAVCNLAAMDEEAFARAMLDVMLVASDEMHKIEGMFARADAKNRGDIDREVFVAFCVEEFGRKVVLKFMRQEDQYRREVDSRQTLELDSRYVVNVLRYHDESDGRKFAESLSHFIKPHLGTDDNAEDYCHLLVMPCGDRSLDSIFRNECPDETEVKRMLEEVGEVLAHVHNKGLIHGNFKMSKIVRVNGRLCLIDMEASARIDRGYAGVKFSSGVTPPEMIYGISDFQQVQKVAEYYKNGGDGRLHSARSPKISYIPTKKWCVVRCFLMEKRTIEEKDSETGESIETVSFVPRTEGLPFTLVKATPSIDLWAFGILIHTMCTGGALFKVNRNDDIEEGNSLRTLFDWCDLDLETSIQDIEDNTLKDLLMNMLHRDDARRPSIQQVLAHPFFHPESEASPSISEATLPSEDDESSLEVAPPPPPLETGSEDPLMQIGDMDTPQARNRKKVGVRRATPEKRGDPIVGDTVSLVELEELSHKLEELENRLSKQQLQASQEGQDALLESEQTDLASVEVARKGWLQKQSRHSRFLWQERYFVLYKNATVTYFKNAYDVNDPANGGSSFFDIKWFQVPDPKKKEDFELRTQSDVPIMKLRLSKLSTSSVQDWLGSSEDDRFIVHKGWLQKQSRQKLFWQDRYFVLHKSGTVTYFSSSADASNPRKGGASFSRVKWEQIADESRKEDFVLKTRADVPIMKLRLSKLSTSTAADWLKGNQWLSMLGRSSPRSTRNRVHVTSTVLGTPAAIIYENEQATFGALSDFDTVDSGERKKAKAAPQLNPKLTDSENEGEIYVTSISSTGSEDSAKVKTHRKSPSASSVNFAGVVESQKSEDSVADERMRPSALFRESPSSRFKREGVRLFMENSIVTRLRKSIETKKKAKRKQRRETILKKRNSLKRFSASSLGVDDGLVGDYGTVDNGEQKEQPTKQKESYSMQNSYPRPQMVMKM